MTATTMEDVVRIVEAKRAEHASRAAQSPDPPAVSSIGAEAIAKVRVFQPPPEKPAPDPETVRKRLWARFAQLRGQLHRRCSLENYRQEHPGQREVVEALRAYCQNMPAEIAAGNGIVLFGAVGTGKDHLLTAVARVAILTHGIAVLWVNGLDLYGELRDRIHNDESERQWVRSMVAPPVLYVSDPIPPIGGLTPYQASMLLRILDGRNREIRSTWVSMNVNSSVEAAHAMGTPLVDRLKPGSIGAFCDWPSARKIRMVWSGRKAGGA